MARNAFLCDGSEGEVMLHCLFFIGFGTFNLYSLHT